MQVVSSLSERVVESLARSTLPSKAHSCVRTEDRIQTQERLPCQVARLRMEEESVSNARALHRQKLIALITKDADQDRAQAQRMSKESAHGR